MFWLIVNVIEMIITLTYLLICAEAMVARLKNKNGNFQGKIA